MMRDLLSLLRALLGLPPLPRRVVHKVGNLTVTLTGYTEEQEARFIAAVKKSQERNSQ